MTSLSLWTGFGTRAAGHWRVVDGRACERKKGEELIGLNGMGLGEGTVAEDTEIGDIILW